MPPVMRAAVSALALAAVAALAPSAVAAPGWLTPQTLSPDTGDAVAARGALDAAGNAVAVWQQGAGGGASAVMAATRAPGGAWSPAQALSAAGDGDAELPVPSALDPDVAVSPGGLAVAVWRFRDGGGQVVESAVRAPGGAWTPPQVISRAARRYDAPAVSVDAAGNAVAVWVRQGQESMSVQAASRPAGGAWSPPVTISAPGATEAATPVAASGPGGVVAAWAWRGGPGDLWRVQAAVRAPGAAWGQATDISVPAQDPSVPDAVTDASGRAVVAWDRGQGTGSVVQAAARPAGGAWSLPVPLTDADGAAGAPRLALLTDGRVVAAMPQRSGPLTGRLAVRIAAATGEWGPADLLGDAADLAGDPRVAALPAGGVMIAWNACPPSAPCRVQAATAGPAGWVRRDPASAELGVGRLSADAAGNALLVGTRFQDGSPSALAQALVFDAAGPDLAGVAVPETAVAGAAVNMSLVGVDAWSALAGQPRWEFSDGTAAAEGQQVSHVFAAVGDQTVTVTLSDVLGNASVVVRTVRVTAPPPDTLPVLTTGGAAGLAVRNLRALCIPLAAGGCRVTVSFRLASAARVRVRVALRGRRGSYSVVIRGRKGVNALRLPERIGRLRLGSGTRLAVTVTPLTAS